MTDTEILRWLVANGAIDTSVLSYNVLMGNVDAVGSIRDRLRELTPENVDAPTCGEPAPYFVWGGMPCSLPAGHAGKHGHPEDVEEPT